MAEADVLTVCINTLAAGMVSGGVVNVERSSPDPCELSCELAPEMLRYASESRPLGQESGPARPAECTARPNVSPMRMVSETKTAAAHSRPEEGSTVPHLEACPRPRTYSRLGGKMWPLVMYTGNL